MRTAIIVLLVLFVCGAFSAPAWNGNVGWGPSSGIGTVLLILLLLLLFGVI